MSAQPMTTRPSPSPRRKPASLGPAKTGSAEITIALLPSVSPADLGGGSTSPEPSVMPTPHQRPHTAGRRRTAVLASGLSLLTSGTFVLVAIALARP